MNQTQKEQTAEIQVDNIGGIKHAEIECPPGVTVLAGRNATNRTSFLQGVMAAMGSDDATLKADAEEGAVELTLGDETYSRHLFRENGTIRSDGEPYLDDPTLADLFAFLLESNDARQAVARNDDLREVIMRPVDTAAIEAEIEQLERRRDDIDERLDELDSLATRLPELEEDQISLKAQIEEKREELAATEMEIEELNADVDETREEKAELESRLDDLREVRTELETTRDRIESEQASIDALEAERQEIDAALKKFSEVPEERIGRIDEKIQRLHGQVQAIETTIGDLQSIIQFNQDTLGDERPDLVSELQDVETDGAITNQLVDDEDTICWTCGSTVKSSQIETTLEQLQELHREKTGKRESLQAQISELRAERSELEEQRNERKALETKRRDIAEEIETRQDRLEELTDRRDELIGEVEHHEDVVQDLQREDYSEVIDLHTEANQLEFEVEQLGAELDDAEAEIERIETNLDTREELKAQRDELQSELQTLRTRIDDLERGSVDAFNDHMDDVLELLGYANLERIWIDRAEREVRDGRRTVTQSHFELNVVRSTDDGTIYEDTVDHLSESEREVTGLVFALAGYLAHEVYEDIPFMLLDSVEAIDSNRIADLLHYFEEFTDYLLVALLPEDAAALHDGLHRISEF